MGKASTISTIMIVIATVMHISEGHFRVGKRAGMPYNQLYEKMVAKTLKAKLMNDALKEAFARVHDDSDLDTAQRGALNDDGGKHVQYTRCSSEKSDGEVTQNDEMRLAGKLPKKQSFALNDAHLNRIRERIGALVQDLKNINSYKEAGDEARLSENVLQNDDFADDIDRLIRNVSELKHGLKRRASGEKRKRADTADAELYKSTA
eukprot:Seg3208.4 transcript_id=Seg3208.4/GoldUCD/mRNA.D3Y31 product="hypothetical protein" protein_id=Seg3208.4/GoldUCD/D3Y31